MIWPNRKQGVAPAPDARPADPVAQPVAKAAPKILAAPEPSRSDIKTDLKVELHQKLLDRINLAALESMTREQVGRDIGDIVAEMLKELNHALNLAERNCSVARFWTR